MRIKLLLTSLLIFSFAHLGSGQAPGIQMPTNNPEMRMDSTQFVSLDNLNKGQNLAKLSMMTKPSRLKAYLIPSLESTNAFFCRIESKIEQTSRVPLRFRLGSLNYVNYLEKKGQRIYFYSNQN